MLEELRAKHPVLRYRSYSCTVEKAHLRCRFEIVLEPDFVFYPEVSFEFHHPVEREVLEHFAFHLGLVELLSYWKAACPPLVVIEAGMLTEEQLAWWHDLYLHGLGEFFYRNDIDFTVPDFLTLKCESTAKPFEPRSFPGHSGALVLTAGGKDSAVTLEILGQESIAKTAMALNPTRAALDAARIAGYTHPVIVRRKIDPLLLRLNQAGYLNGHTPFSAYLAFCGMFAAALFGFRDIIVSNERSSSEPNTHFQGYPINHQYSKSVRFEQLFREYAARWLSPDLNYFSFLRPLYDLQVAALFAQFPQHFSSFRSCNVLQGQDAWCCKCSKCAFVYVSLCPFINASALRSIFGKDLFEEPTIQHHLRGLTGVEHLKPFECVGTHDESRLAVALSVQKLQLTHQPVPPFLSKLHAEMRSRNLTSSHTQTSFTGIHGEHFLPEFYRALLERIVSQKLSLDDWNFDEALGSPDSELSVTNAAPNA